VIFLRISAVTLLDVFRLRLALTDRSVIASVLACLSRQPVTDQLSVLQLVTGRVDAADIVT
jgi:hypothetical protein